MAAYDRVIGLDLRDCSVDASLQKAPRAGEGAGPSPVDRGKRGWKWSLFTDRNGIPLGWVAAPANRNDCVLLEPTLAEAARRGLVAECETLHLDRGYDNGVVRAAVFLILPPEKNPIHCPSGEKKGSNPFSVPGSSTDFD